LRDENAARSDDVSFFAVSFLSAFFGTAAIQDPATLVAIVASRLPMGRALRSYMIPRQQCHTAAIISVNIRPVILG
jgi:hypothetical protein